MEQSRESDQQVALFLQGVKDHFNFNCLTEIDELLDEHFASEDGEVDY